MDMNSVTSRVFIVKPKNKTKELIGYKVNLATLGKTLFVDNAQLAYLITNGYVRGRVNRIGVAFAPKGVPEEIVRRPIKCTFTDDELVNALLMNKVHKLDGTYEKSICIPDTACANKAAELINAVNELNREAELKEKYVKNIEMSHNTDKYVVCAILITNDGNRNILGYSLAYKGTVYNVTRELAVELCNNKCINGASAQENKYSKLRLVLEDGNRGILKQKIGSMSLINDINALPIRQYTEEANWYGRKVIGAIFNQIGLILGLIVEYNNDILKIKLPDIPKFEEAIGKISYIKVISDEVYNKHKHSHNVHNTIMYGKRFLHQMNVKSPLMTLDMAKDIFDRQNIIVINDGIDYGNLDMRKNILRCADKLLSTKNTLTRIDISLCKAVATIKHLDIATNKLKDTSSYVIEANGELFIAKYSTVRGILPDEPLNDYVVIQNGEIRYRDYRDSGEICLYTLMGEKDREKV